MERPPTCGNCHYQLLFDTIPVHSQTQAVSAGIPVVHEDSSDYFEVPRSIVRYPDRTQIWEVRGHSMAESLLDGDRVLVELQRHAYSGDVIVAYLHGKMSLKRYVERERRKFLCPDNEAYPEIEIDDENFSVVGKVKYLIRGVR